MKSEHAHARATWLGAILCLALAGPAPAQAPATGTSRALALTLEQTIRLALDNNRTLVSARRRRDTEKLSLEPTITGQRAPE